MLTIRLAQVQEFARCGRERWVEELAQQLRRRFGAFAAEYSPEELRENIRRTVQDCAVYGLVSSRDCQRFVNLAPIYGWQFDRKPANEWMTRILRDGNVTHPGDRLHRLIDACLIRMKQREDTERILQQHGFAAADSEDHGSPSYVAEL